LIGKQKSARRQVFYRVVGMDAAIRDRCWLAQLGPCFRPTTAQTSLVAAYADAC